MVNITENAATKVKELLAKENREGQGLRMRVIGGGCSGLQYQMGFDAAKEEDKVFENHGVKVIVDPKSFLYLAGSQVDFEDGLNGAGFKISNPNAESSCGCGKSFGA